MCEYVIPAPAARSNYEHLLRLLNEPRPSYARGGVVHDHKEFVAGCFRCDLNRDEVDD